MSIRFLPRAKLAELQVQLEAAEAKAEAEQHKLMEQMAITQSTAQTPTTQPPQEHLCSRCGRSFSTASIDSNGGVIGNRKFSAASGMVC